MAHDDERGQGHDNGRATPDGVIVVAAFAVVLVGLTWVGVAVGQRVAGVVHTLDVLGDLLGPVVCGKWTAVKSEENDVQLIQWHRHRRECVAEVMM